MDQSIRTYDAIVVGTGASGYAAALRIASETQKSVCIVTEAAEFGTSRNTGSDKQTYYKLGLGGDAPDSVRMMAETLFTGGCVDGDNALCEAALSARCFHALCELGVPFPTNRYGEYIGYKTDHDPFARATSAGPLTSKYMTEALEKRVKQLGVPVFDGLTVIEILKNENGVCGLIALDRKTGDPIPFRTAHLILATGGPSGIYADTVYPDSQHGATGLAIDVGASLQNLTEWQYGLASVSPRWNVSGTYMQVLPRFLSVDENGTEYEFLTEYYHDPYEALDAVFLKGYQWPFDAKKAKFGSSRIDLCVYTETVLRNRKVYLDFTQNPFGLAEIDYHKLSAETRQYLIQANACFGTPIERLSKMNKPAIELYQSKGVDLTKERLGIALSAQHHNGGIAVDLWWQTSVKGLFAIGECAGTHGVTRPGGSALNAGQVGALRAAKYISASHRAILSDERFEALAKAAIRIHTERCTAALSAPEPADAALSDAQRRMSACGAAIRNAAQIEAFITETKKKLQSFDTRFGIASKEERYKLYRLKDTLTVQYAILLSMADYAKKKRHSRGSALYLQNTSDGAGAKRFSFTLDESAKTEDMIQEIAFENGSNAIPTIRWRRVRPIPEDTEAFETVWRAFREHQNIF